MWLAMACTRRFNIYLARRTTNFVPAWCKSRLVEDQARRVPASLLGVRVHNTITNRGEYFYDYGRRGALCFERYRENSD